MDELKQAEKTQSVKASSTKAAAMVGGFLLGVIVLVGIFYLYTTSNQIYTDKANIEAPLVTIATTGGGTLQKMLVANGNEVAAATPVAQVADQILRSSEEGLVVDAKQDIGKTFNPGEPVVTMVNPQQLRLVAHLDEDKGLREIKVGQLATFSVDAFGGKKYTGIVEEISPSARQAGIVFNISDKREVRQFDVKIKFDVNKYPELKNGMSAKVTIFK